MNVKKIDFVKVTFDGFLNNAPQDRCFVMVEDACEYAEKCLSTRVKEMKNCENLPRHIIQDTRKYVAGTGWFRFVVLGCKNSIETLSYRVISQELELHYR